MPCRKRDSSHTFARCYLLDFGGAPLFLLFDNWEVLSRFVAFPSPVTAKSKDLGKVTFAARCQWVSLSQAGALCCRLIFLSYFI